MLMKKIIWTNGCFDVVHRGHIELFRHAKTLGDFLIVGLDSDERVASLKGEGRPVNSLEDRAVLLGCLTMVDQVVSFSTDEELENTIDFFEPDFLVVGEDYKDKRVIGREHVGRVIYFNKFKDHLGESYSTTNILKKNGKK